MAKVTDELSVGPTHVDGEIDLREQDPSEEVHVIEIEGEDQPLIEGDATSEEVEAAPKWVQHVRTKNRELEKQIRELKRTAPKPEEQKQVAPTVGEKPTLEGCEYDADIFEQKLIDWTEAKRKVADAQKDRERAESEQKASWDADLSRYGQQKAELRTKLGEDDFDEAEARVAAALSPDQQAIIVRGATNPAAIISAIGRNSKVLAELAALKDVARFAVEIGKLETRVKVTQRKPTTAPEEPLRGASGSALSGSPTKQLDKLRADAEKSGDYTKVIQFKKQMAAQK